MREIINLSLPSEMANMVKKAVKKGCYASTSEFFRDLIRRWEQEKTYKEVMESEKEFAASKGNVLRSLKDLR